MAGFGEERGGDATRRREEDGRAAEASGRGPQRVKCWSRISMSCHTACTHKHLACQTPLTAMSLGLVAADIVVGPSGRRCHSHWCGWSQLS